MNQRRPVAIDLFCGAGGLTRGLLDAGISVVAGYDVDDACRYAYEKNNALAVFHKKDVVNVKGTELRRLYPKNSIRVLVGCAPCVTFSRYTQGMDRKRDSKWRLLREFARLIRTVRPHIVSMENVPELQNHSVFADFLGTLEDEGFAFPTDPAQRVVNCSEYGVAQHRRRLVLLASRLGPIEMVDSTHPGRRNRTVLDVLGSLPSIAAGGQHNSDPMHRASSLSDLNLRRVRCSRPGRTWRDWPNELLADCHTVETGKTYSGVYARMEWHKPSPTITTQFYGFGNGRFGHPEQNRALSLREGAILQSFPRWYAFVEPGSPYSFKRIGRMIGNAVPVRLGKAIGRSIMAHLAQHAA